jgi:transmembrane sensor
MRDNNENEMDTNAEFETAMDWAAKLVLGTITVAERQQLETWKQGNPARKEYVNEALLAFGSPTTVIAAADIAESETTEATPVVRLAPKSTRKRYLVPSGIAAACLIVGLIFTLLNVGNGASYNTIYSAESADKHLVLEDGSDLTIAKGSRIQVNFSPEKREISLLKGEAFFDVVPDTRRPFIVNSANGHVRVTGTQFNVNNWRKGTSITVVEGAVDWQPKSRSEKISLAKGDRLSVQTGEPGVKTKVALGSYVDWRSGWVTADQMPIAEVASKLTRYSETPIKLGVDIEAELKVTGRFKLSQTDATLSSLAQLYNLKVIRTQDYLLVSRK